MHRNFCQVTSIRVIATLVGGNQGSLCQNKVDDIHTIRLNIFRNDAVTRFMYPLVVVVF